MRVFLKGGKGQHAATIFLVSFCQQVLSNTGKRHKGYSSPLAATPQYTVYKFDGHLNGSKQMTPTDH